MTRLVFIAPEFAPHTCELAEGRTSVGRGPKNKLVIQEPSVSADHCEILVNSREVIVREHHSSNGTWIDGKRVEGQWQLKHGQVIRFGKVEARLELPPDPADNTASAITALHPHMKAMLDQQAPRPAQPPEHQIVQSPDGAAPQNQTVSMPAVPRKTVSAAPAVPNSKETRTITILLLLTVLTLAVWWLTRR